jgi:hypothetical protein
VKRGLRGRDGRGDLTNVQYKPIWNSQNKTPLHNDYILIKNFFKKNLGSHENLSTKKTVDPEVLSSENFQTFKTKINGTISKLFNKAIIT